MIVGVWYEANLKIGRVHNLYFSNYVIVSKYSSLFK